MDSFQEIGKDVEIFDPVTFIGRSNIVIKERVRISEFVLISAGLGTFIGNFVHVANHASIIGGGVCILEDFVGICAGVRIITGTDDTSGNGIPSPMVPGEYRSFYRSHVVCKKHSFIGTNVIIHPGVTIGEGTVVASGSVVTKDLEPWSIYMGTPAKKVKERNRDIIEKMELEIYGRYNILPSDFDNIIKH